MSSGSTIPLSSSTSSLNLASFPEELLERILTFCVVSSTDLPPPRPSWHQKPSSGTPNGNPFPSLDAMSLHDRETYAGKGRTSPLFVNKLFLRIATPLFYHTIHITSRNQASVLLHTFSNNASLAQYVRRISVSGIWLEMGDVLGYCSGVQALDITLTCGDDGLSGTSTPTDPFLGRSGQVAPLVDTHALEFADALSSLKGIRHIALRKMNHVYLTHTRPRYLIKRIALAMQHWDQLETVHIAFRLSDDSVALTYPMATPPEPTSEVPHQNPLRIINNLSPITALTTALRTRPRLHTFSTHLPSVWNNSILMISQNEALQRIILGDGNWKDGETGAGCGAGSFGIPRHQASANERVSSGACGDRDLGGFLGTGLFLMEVRKHPRLAELIRAGTPAGACRTRAHTHV